MRVRIHRVGALLLWSLLVAGCTAVPPAADPAPSPPPPGRTSDPAALAPVFDGLGASPFDEAGVPTADGTRVLDVLALQGGLIRYRAQNGSYPDALDALVPAIVPALPRDPGNGSSYPYRRLTGGTAYEISTVLSNGRAFSGAAHQER